MEFSELGLNKSLLKSLKKMGATTLFPVQEISIPLVLEGKNVVVQSHTGSGKTLAYLVPLLNNLEEPKKNPTIVVVCPTRELSLQVHTIATHLVSKTPFVSHCVFGGEKMRIQKRRIKKGVDILIGTPGKIIIHANNQHINLSEVQTVVLDEGDKLIKKDFIHQIEEILKQCTNKEQILLFSATAPQAAQTFMAEHNNTFTFIDLSKEQLITSAITHYYIETKKKEKFDVLKKIILHKEYNRVIVFCRTKWLTEKVFETLKNSRFIVGILHSGLRQGRRKKTIELYSKHTLNILVATNIAARGIDFKDVSHIINFDVSRNDFEFVHRAGRSGRVNATGKTVTFVSPETKKVFQDIIKELHINPIKIDHIPEVSEENKTPNQLKPNEEITDEELLRTVPVEKKKKEKSGVGRKRLQSYKKHSSIRTAAPRRRPNKRIKR